MITELPDNPQEVKMPITLKKALSILGYYFDGRLKRFYLDEHQQLRLKKVEGNEKSIPLLILSRQYYSELAKTYPIDNKSELKKLLKLEFIDEPSTHYHVWHQKDGYSQVNIWRFVNNIPAALITLPESLLIALGNDDAQVAQVKTDSTLFVGRHNALVHSALSNTVITSCQRFVMSTGVLDSRPIRNISADTFAQQLASGFNKAIFPALSAFIRAPERALNLQIVKKILIPFSLVFSCYLIASSTYLVGINYLLQQGGKDQTKEINQVLAAQQEVDLSLQRFLQLKAFWAEQQNSSQLWLVLPELFPYAQFSNIRIVDGRYVLRGSAQKATDLLARLSSLEQVVDAKFDYPTRKSKGRELFVIGFSFSAVKMAIAEAGEIKRQALIQDEVAQND
ncbi:hypothetical protein [Thalassomonas haliotis]|uniref:GspL cytoplasmic actin-ATPase-like domain-containing protein n=1 Tax=Thalassomonas haliotis TaxID=485448 RepID=A0ABY7VJC8_9GAMM|nr:hypothetical protein [Thalassomonas haliotis]WDE13269.1 hypothetical protein H3N35_07470 [Thalassomonas haliotis]